jgi:phosphate:Na+ symporter
VLADLGLRGLHAVALLPLARLLARPVPGRPAPVEGRRPRHLDPAALDTPAEPLACAGREALRTCDHVEAMLARVIQVFATGDARLAHEVEVQARHRA